MRGILEEHDNIVRQYRTRKQRAAVAKTKGDHEMEWMMEGYAEGIGYVYCQLFGKNIEDAHEIGYYELTSMNKWPGVWKWRENV